MNELEQKNLLQIEAQVSDELSFEEIDAVAGGGLIAGLVGAVGGYAIARFSGASVADSMKAGAAVGTFGLAIPAP